MKHREPDVRVERSQKDEPLGGPTVRVHLNRYPGVESWTVTIVGPGNVRAVCTGPTFAGCVDHLNDTGVPQKWFGEASCGGKNP